MGHWCKKEIEYLKENYPAMLDKDLSSSLNRSLKAISYMANKLKIKKDKNFYSQSRKHRKDLDITKEKLEKLYLVEGYSIRKIAQNFNIGKTTIEYYFKKYHIQRRDTSSANKLYYSRNNSWIKGLNKYVDERVNALSRSIKENCKRKREDRLKMIESIFNLSMPNLLNKLYWGDKSTQQQIANKIGLSRETVIKLMKEFDIKKRPNFEHISSLKGKNHSHYGKSWDEIFGKQKAEKLRKKVSKTSRGCIIKRLKNNKIPSLNTAIERLLAKELSKRNITFRSQFPIANRFVCDFAIPGLKIAIECDGDYWHANPKLYPKNKLNDIQKKKLKLDQNKELCLRTKGWKLFRFTESDIKLSVEKCAEKIEEEIRRVKLCSTDSLNRVKSPLDTV